DPVVVAVLAATFDHAQPRLALLERRRHLFGHRRWHVGMANQAMGPTSQLGTVQAADFGENEVSVAGPASRTGRRAQALLDGKSVLTLGYGLVITHRQSRLQGYS